MIYDFKKQLDMGKAGEWVMDKYHAPHYAIKKASRSEDHRGIDRWYRRDGRRYSVEIKTCGKVQDTGNIIINNRLTV